MKKNIPLYIIMIIHLFFTPLAAESLDSAKKAGIPGDELADVAILDFVNNTGNSDYDWLKTSLSDAIYDSMKGVFEFRRTKKEWVQKIASETLAGKNELDIADIRFIAENTSSDIIIFGNYTFDNIKKKIIIHTKIFHLSRDNITGAITLDAPVDSSLFNVVDRVALQCVDHIEEIALEDEAERIKLASLEKMKKSASEKEGGKKKKIVLKKAKSEDKKFRYDSWYSHIYPMISRPMGILSEDLETGIGVRFGISNSYGSFWHFGGVTSVHFFENVNIVGISGELTGMTVASFRLSGGINFRFFNRFIVQPFITSGFSIERIWTSGASGGIENAKSYYTMIISAGVKFPVRIFGIFITPLFEYTRIVDPTEEVAMINIGLGVSF